MTCAAALLAAGLALLWCFGPALRFLVQTWRTVGEYGHGWFVPPIVAYLVWLRRGQLAALELRGAWSGLVLIGVGLLMNLVAVFSAIRVFGQYGFVVAVYGFAACTLGWRGTRVIAVPLAFLFFMIPLPQFLLRELSEQLQLLSSQLGVAMMRLLGISVFLDGNVIDLGTYKLQVVEACSGLRYLFPLLTLGALAAWFFRGATWQRALLVVSTVPLTLVINSLRIALVGWSVEHWGGGMAEGLLHDAEGLFMFLVCIALLAIEAMLLARWTARPAKDAQAAATSWRWPVIQAPLVAGVALAVLSGCATERLPARAADRVPARDPLAQFPLALAGGWTGTPGRIEQPVLDALAVDDHLYADYRRADDPPVNLLVAYYAAQSGGESVHSPRTCIPGGGWQIAEIGTVHPTGTQQQVVRAVIARGEQRQLVYFWFAQRGRVLTSEIAVKWYILRDALLLGRSDGALVRLVTPMPDGESAGHADERLAAFMRASVPPLAASIPS